MTDDDKPIEYEETTETFEDGTTRTTRTPKTSDNEDSPDNTPKKIVRHVEMAAASGDKKRKGRGGDLVNKTDKENQ